MVILATIVLLWFLVGAIPRSFWVRRRSQRVRAIGLHVWAYCHWKIEPLGYLAVAYTPFFAVGFSRPRGKDWMTGVWVGLFPCSLFKTDHPAQIYRYNFERMW